MPRYATDACYPFRAGIYSFAVMNEGTGATQMQNPGVGSLIYIVDDEPMLLELASIILAPFGYQLKTFRDPDVALAAFRDARPRPPLIITDYAMHRMNGLRLMEACRELESQQKVLLVSGTVGPEVFRDSPVKPDGFLSKPYTAQQLIDVVKAALGT